MYDSVPWEVEHHAPAKLGWQSALQRGTRGALVDRGPAVCP